LMGLILTVGAICVSYVGYLMYFVWCVYDIFVFGANKY